MHWMRRLISLGVFVALAVGGDVAARQFVESMVDTRAKQEAPPGTAVSASVGGFPFVPRILLTGKVSSAGVHLENVTAGPLVLAEVDIDLHGVELDRGRLISQRKARITAIDRGRVTSTVTAPALSEALGGVPVRMAEGTITLTVAGRDVPVTASVNAQGRLTLSGEFARPFTLTIPPTDYVPCVGEVTVLAGRMTTSCEIRDVPPALLDVVQDAVG